jgi:hypothetical protein
MPDTFICICNKSYSRNHHVAIHGEAADWSWEPLPRRRSRDRLDWARQGVTGSRDLLPARLEADRSGPTGGVRLSWAAGSPRQSSASTSTTHFSISPHGVFRFSMASLWPSCRALSLADVWTDRRVTELSSRRAPSTRWGPSPVNLACFREHTKRAPPRASR